MKKIAILFVLGIFLPALVLGVLALQSARQQGVLIADQEAKLRQQEADGIATQVQLALRVEHESFVKLVQELVENGDPESVARDFTTILQSRRPGRGLGFSVSTAGQIFSPQQARVNPASAESEFIAQNGNFLKSRSSAEVYATVSESLADVQQSIQSRTKNSNGYNLGSVANSFSRADDTRTAETVKAAPSTREQIPAKPDQGSEELRQQVAAPSTTEVSNAAATAQTEGSVVAANESQERLRSNMEGEKKMTDMDAAKTQLANRADALEKSNGDAAEATKFAGQVLDAADKTKEKADVTILNNFNAAGKMEVARKVAPQRVSNISNNSKDSENQKLMSNLLVSNSRFGDLVAKESSGILSRFVDDRLEIMFWARPEKRPDIVFGVRVLPEDFRELINKVVQSGTEDGGDIVAAVLDDRAKPFVRSDATFTARWQQPFVAAEVGEVLPHWEVGLYLRDAERLGRTARLTSLSIMGLIALALGAIAVGGGLVVMDMRRQLVLVQKKTDFVSNVSHELKTPLTSIRMFAELLQQDTVPDPEKRSHYLRIITVEAERLTRLINNVLDFARMERNQKVYQKEPVDFYEVIRQVWESQEVHLKQHGFKTAWQSEEPPYPVLADADALAQILVNLISNAEKYGGDGKEIELHSYRIDGNVRVAVMDRGLGIPAGEEKKIFEHFYRAHDSLSSGIQGSGLGLTLAQKIAEEHGGSISCEARKDGGTRFTLQLPLIKSAQGNTL